MKINSTILLIFFFTIIVSCKSTKSSQKSENVASCKLLIGFISKGAGPDSKTRESLEAYVTEFSKKTGKNVIFNETN